MGENVLIKMAAGLYRDLEDRPGRNKFEREEAAVPREALRRILERLSREMEPPGGPPHLRPDSFDRIGEDDRLTRRRALLLMLSSRQALVPVPDGSTFADRPHAYIAAFRYPSLRLSVIGAYLEADDLRVLVLLRALPMTEAAALMKRLRGAAAFDELYASALDEVASSP